MPRRIKLAIFLCALALRLGFVAWAPGEPSGDGLFYHQHGHDLMLGNGYVNVDRSPANTWMPGWPALLALLYAVFGVHAKVAMAANALLGAATAWGVAVLGERVFSTRIGVIAGALYAVWPGLIYFVATLFNETLFSCLLVLALLLLVDAGQERARRALRAGVAGLALGCAALVKAEPLVLLVPFCGYLWLCRQSTRDFAWSAACLTLVTLALVAPWTLRNYLVFDRLIPTSAGGGMVIYAANHPGASGGNDLAFLVRWLREHDAIELTQAEQNLLIQDHAWPAVWAFVREHPGEQLRVMASKLRLTYAGDSEGADLVRGFFGRERWHLDEVSWRRLVRVADAWWYTMAVALGIGLACIRDWPAATRVLLLGPLASWLGLHLVFMGGMRFHVPEIPIYALIAAAGIDAVVGRLERR